MRVLIGVILVLALAGTAYAQVRMRIDAMQRETDAIQQWMDSAEVAEKKRAMEASDNRQNQLKTYSALVGTAREAIGKSNAVSAALLNSLADLVPSGIQIDSISVAGGTLELVCKTRDGALIASFLYSIEQSVDFEQVHAVNVTADADGSLSFPLVLQVTSEVQHESD